MKPFRMILPLAALLLGACAGSPARAAAQPDTLRLATWNMEWLMSPTTAHRLRQQCLGGRRGRLPCDVVLQRPRSEADLRAIAREAAALAADVIALQEVEDERAAARVFPGHAFCFTRRADLQNVGFAIRRGLPFRCGPDVEALSLGDRLRRGAQLTLFPGEARELRLLSVHLKSGCRRDELTAGNRDCAQLARQAPVLGRWIDEQVAAGRAFAVLGDFNRDLRGERARGGAGLWGRIADGEPVPEKLRDASEGTPFRACHAGQSFTTYIDYVLLGGPLGARMVPGSFRRHVFRDRDAQRHRLPDHCAVSVAVRLR